MPDRSVELVSYAPMAAHLIKYTAEAQLMGVRLRRFGSSMRQHIAYLPPYPDAPGRDVLVCFIHGGGWSSGSAWGYRACLPLFARAGYPCLSAGYRYAPRNQFPAQAHDVIASIYHAWEEAARDGLKPRGVALVGHSAGGHLAGLLGVTDGVQRALGLPVLGAVPISGVLDMQEGLRAEGDLPRMIADFAGERLAEADPVQRLRPGMPPILCIHGDMDPIVPIEGARRFVRAAQSLQPDCARLVELPGAGHVEAMQVVFPEQLGSLAVLGFMQEL